MCVCERIDSRLTSARQFVCIFLGGVAPQRRAGDGGGAFRSIAVGQATDAALSVGHARGSRLALMYMRRIVFVFGSRARSRCRHSRKARTTGVLVVVAGVVGSFAATPFFWLERESLSPMCSSWLERRRKGFAAAAAAPWPSHPLRVCVG